MVCYLWIMVLYWAVFDGNMMMMHDWVYML